MGGSGSHSRECGRGGERSWLGGARSGSEARPWSGEFGSPRAGTMTHGHGHACHGHGGHQNLATTSQQQKQQVSSHYYSA